MEARDRRSEATIVYYYYSSITNDLPLVALLIAASLTKYGSVWEGRGSLTRRRVLGS